jgi:pSer/pThr/pTyr-binding forkhead associated (FHA) protein
MQDPEFRELPTPQPLGPDAMAKEQDSFLERLLVRWKLVAGLVGIGLVIALVSGVLLWRSGRSGSTKATFDSPPSLQELAQQFPDLADLLNDPTLGSVYKEFIVTYERGGIEAAEELAARRGLLNDRGEIRITLVVDIADYIPTLVEELQGAGITVEGSYKERINIGVPLALIRQLAEQQGTDVLFGQLTQMEHIIRLELPAPRRSDVLLAGGEGVSVTGAGGWHAAGFTGESIRIGVLDLGFDGYRRLLGTELPETVVSASFIYGKQPDATGDVHGTACSEIVHEMAPGAELFLAAYDTSLVSMGQAVDWLLSQGVHIISNSTSGVVGPMDGSDESAKLVDDAVSRGVLWVNSSGNSGHEHYRGSFLDTDRNGFHEFPDGTELMVLNVHAPDIVFALNWDDWRNVTEDYDLLLYDEQGDLVASSEDIQLGLPGQVASESLVGKDVPEGVYYIAVKAHSTTRPGILDIYTVGAAPEFPVAEHSLCSPADALGALAVGATGYRNDSLAAYSSQGPSNDGRLKPELAAPAGVSTATYAPDAFHGTSASTPHVAGAAALVWSAFPNLNARQVQDYLQTHALDLAPPGLDNGHGYGRLQLPAPPGETGGLPLVPTVLPTVPSLPTQVPEPTAGALLPEPVEKPSEAGASDAGSLLLVGTLGLLGALVALGGGVLLVFAMRRSPRRAAQAVSPSLAPALDSWGALPAPSAPQVPPPPPPPRETAGDYGSLVGARGTIARLGPGRMLIGRSSRSDIVLDSLLVSRGHARVECAGGQCTIEDLGSANGLFVNHRRVSRAMLSPGDRLRLGDVELTYRGAGPPPAQAWLQVGADRVPLAPEGTTIGRSRDSNILLADDRVSRRHARIDLRQGVFVISDLGSANGTLVNGQRIQRQALRDGDEIRIGDTRLTFHR